MSSSSARVTKGTCDCLRIALDSRFGLLEVFGGEGAQPDKMTRALGEAWDV
jgi:hypothetical protein